MFFTYSMVQSYMYQFSKRKKKKPTKIVLSKPKLTPETYMYEIRTDNSLKLLEKIKIKKNLYFLKICFAFFRDLFLSSCRFVRGHQERVSKASCLAPTFSMVWELWASNWKNLHKTEDPQPHKRRSRTNRSDCRHVWDFQAAQRMWKPQSCTYRG